MSLALLPATNESLLRVVGHKCVKEVEILSCSGRVNNEGSVNTNLVDLIIYLKNNNGKITNMIETTTRPLFIASSEHGIYNITVGQSRLTPDWVTSELLLFLDETPFRSISVLSAMRRQAL